MEALLSQSAKGVHVLFENDEIAKVFKEDHTVEDHYTPEKMKAIQDIMTELVSKKGYFEKMAFLQSLDKEDYDTLIRAYFHIVENTVRANHNLSH